MTVTVQDLVHDQGVRGPALTPGSPEWLQSVSASKIAAILGLSPWESRFSLWHRMMGEVGPVETTDEMRRGHYLEPAVRAWFRDQHPTWQWARFAPATWTRADNLRWTASPDDEAIDDTGMPVLAEYKSDSAWWQWGEQHTDEIPVHYRAQGMWQMIVTGFPRCHFAVIDGTLTFREYVLEYDQAEVQILIDAANRFLTDLDEANRPDIDDADATYQVIRQLHPEIDGSDIELPDQLTHDYLTAHADKATAEAKVTGITSRIADLMGTAKRARHGAHTIASRQARKNGTPYVVKGRNLPDPTQILTSTNTPGASS